MKGKGKGRPERLPSKAYPRTMKRGQADRTLVMLGLTNLKTHRDATRKDGRRCQVVTIGPTPKGEPRLVRLAMAETWADAVEATEKRLGLREAGCRRAWKR